MGLIARKGRDAALCTHARSRRRRGSDMTTICGDGGGAVSGLSLSLSLSLQAFGEPTNHWRVCSTYTHPSRNLGRMSTKTSKSTTVKSQYKFTWKAFSHDSRVVENLLSPLTPLYGMVDEEFRCVHRSGASLFRPLPPKIQCR